MFLEEEFYILLIHADITMLGWTILCCARSMLSNTSEALLKSYIYTYSTALCAITKAIIS